MKVDFAARELFFIVCAFQERLGEEGQDLYETLEEIREQLVDYFDTDAMSTTPVADAVEALLREGYA